MIISFSGPDGSGKSTLSKEICDALENRKAKVKLFHIHEFFVLKNIFRQIQRSHHVSMLKQFDYTQKNKLYIIPIILTIFDSWIHYFYLKTWSLLGYTVICDRYFYDRVAGYLLHGYLTKRLASLYISLIPNPTTAFLLTINPKTAAERETDDKHDLTFHRKISKVYSTLFRDHRLVHLDGNSDLNKLTAQCMYEI